MTGVLIGAVISAIGLLVTYLWAPEPANISLTKSCSVEPAAQPVAAEWTTPDGGYVDDPRLAAANLSAAAAHPGAPGPVQTV